MLLRLLRPDFRADDDHRAADFRADDDHRAADGDVAADARG